MNKEEKKQVKALLDSLDKIAEACRDRNEDIARPFVLEGLVDYYREKLLGIKTKPRFTMTIICSRRRRQ